MALADRFVHRGRQGVLLGAQRRDTPMSDERRKAFGHCMKLGQQDCQRLTTADLVHRPTETMIAALSGANVNTLHQHAESVVLPRLFLILNAKPCSQRALAVA